MPNINLIEKAKKVANGMPPESYAAIHDLISLTMDLMDNCNDLRERCLRAESKIGNSNHTVEANQMVLTAEQREALEMLLDACFAESLLSIEDFWKCERAVQSLLSGSKPAWEATDERIAAMKDACNFLVYAEIRNKGVNPGSVDRAKNAGDVLRTMLEEGKRDA